VVDCLARGVDDRMAEKRVMFFAHFLRQLEQTVNLPREGGRSVQSGVREKGGGGVRTRGSGHTREID
jgi:hypothetical protein